MCFLNRWVFRVPNASFRLKMMVVLGGVWIGFSQGIEASWLDRSGWSDWPVTGFLETRLGMRLRDVPHQDMLTLSEMRFHLDYESYQDWGTVFLSGDVLLDGVSAQEIELNEGQGWFDLRQANVLFRPFSFADIKIGRQMVTWGTGDLVFINDLFSKDWVSFISGREDAYLKSPSDVVKLSFFSPVVNVDVVYAPQFDSDRYIRGERVSYFNGTLGKVSGQDAVVTAQKRDDWFGEDELFLRAFRHYRGMEAAVYYYDGFWKSPGGVDQLTGEAVFPALSVMGSSLRGTAFGGLFWIEAGYYDSREDRLGTNPLIANSEIRTLVGFEHDVWSEATLSVQYYLEVMADYAAYEDNAPEGSILRDAYRHVVTARLTQFFLDQRLRVSLFNFYSPSDRDGFLRPNMAYEVSDSISVDLGGQFFYGESDSTFFGQFSDNTSVYGAVRVGF